jgi:hypothetical protein
VKGEIDVSISSWLVYVTSSCLADFGSAPFWSYERVWNVEIQKKGTSWNRYRLKETFGWIEKPDQDPPFSFTLEPRLGRVCEHMFEFGKIVIDFRCQELGQ